MHLYWQLAAWHLAAGNGVDKLLFTALRVLGPEYRYFNALAPGSRLAHGLDSFHLVVLYGYYAALYAKRAHFRTQAVHNPAGFFYHQPIVSRKERFALCAVQYNRIAGLAFGKGKLNVRGEARAAHAAYARGLYRGNYQRGVNCFHVAVALYAVHPFVGKIILYANAHNGSRAGDEPRLNGRNFAGYAGVYGKAKPADRFAYKLAYLYMIALAYARLRRSTQMHAHGNDHRIGNKVPYRGISGRQLTLVLGMQRMYAALEGILWQTKHLPFDVMRNMM